MQVTTEVQEKGITWLNYFVIVVGIVVGFSLFGLVVARMGLFNGLFGGAEATAVSSDSILYTAKSMRFGQDTLVVQAGETVALELANQDMYAHSFDIDELDWHVHMPANEQVSAAFTAKFPDLPNLLRHSRPPRKPVWLPR